MYQMQYSRDLLELLLGLHGARRSPGIQETTERSTPMKGFFASSLILKL